jgi:hypothetical protein
MRAHRSDHRRRHRGPQIPRWSPSTKKLSAWSYGSEGFATRDNFWCRSSYDNSKVGEHRLDLCVEDEIVTELKAIKSLEDVHLHRNET